MLIPVGLMFSYSHFEYVVARLTQHTETFGIQENPMTQSLDFKSLLGENEPVKPPLYKNLFSLKFETGSYLLKSMEKILYTQVNIR